MEIKMTNSARNPTISTIGSTKKHPQVLLFAAVIAVGGSGILALSGGAHLGSLADAASPAQIACQSGGETRQDYSQQNCIAAKPKACIHHLLTREEYVNCLAANRIGASRKLTLPKG
jgi:hypothetical protein